MEVDGMRYTVQASLQYLGRILSLDPRELHDKELDSRIEKA